MKKLKNIAKRNLILLVYIVSLSFITLNTSFAQSSINITHEVVGNTLKLRWQPASFEQFNIISEFGYTLVRYTYSIDSVKQTQSQFNDSQTILCTDCKAMNSIDFESQNFQNEDVAEGVYQILFNYANPTFTSEDMERALDSVNSVENRFTSFAILTSRSFEVAVALGLGYEDNILPNRVYVYKLIIDGYTYDYTVNTSALQPSVPPTIFSIEGGNLASMVSFDQTGLSYNYIGYYFEKSTDSINFNNVNNAPFIYSAKQDSGIANVGYFLDSLAQNNVKYYYRVRGATLFDGYSPYSNIVSVKGRPARLDIIPNLGIKFLSDTSVIFNLSKIPVQHQSKITDISIYNSESPLDGFTKVNLGEIRVEDSLYTDNNLVGSMYYVLTYTDENDHYYKSNAILVQAKDSIPPAIPTGLTAEVFKEGAVILKWNRNTEKDLEGYRLYRANGTGETFIDVLGEDIKDTTYTDFLPNNVLIDSAFYRILSLDYRANYSDYSEIVGISRPDAVPPSDPIIFGAVGGHEGVYLNWAPSSSDDVIHHILERSSDIDAKWTQIIKFYPQDSQFYNSQTINEITFTYIDNNSISYQQYNYRLVAYDDNGNFNASDVISVTPLAAVFEGILADLILSPNCDTSTTTITTSIINGINSAISSITSNGSVSNITTNLVTLLNLGYISVSQYQVLAGQPSSYVISGLNTASTGALAANGSTCYITLRWVYKSTHDPSDVKFEIYRAVNNYTFDLYKTLDSDDFSNTNTAFLYLDTEVVRHRRYSYKIVAINPNNTQSKITNMVTILLN